MNILKKRESGVARRGAVVCGDVRKSSTATRPFFLWGHDAVHKLRTANAALACGYQLSRLRRAPRDDVVFAFFTVTIPD